MNRLRTRLRGYRAASGYNPWTDALALITSTKGWALDPSTASSLWDDSARTVPIGSPPTFIAAADNVANTAAYLAQGTGTSEPAWNGLSFEFDALDDSLNSDATFPSAIRSWVNDIPGWTVSWKMNVSSLSSIRMVLVTTSNFCSIDITTGGSLRAMTRRLAADTNSTLASASGVITAGVDYVCTITCNYQTGLVEGFVNGSSVMSATQTWATGNTAAADVTAVRIGRTFANTNPFGGRIGRMIALPYVASAGQIATLEAGVNATALI